MNGGGYSVDPTHAYAPGVASYQYYNKDTEPVIVVQNGGNEPIFNYVFNLLTPIAKPQIIELITLLLLNNYAGLKKKQKQSGGGPSPIYTTALTSLNQNTLAVILTLILIHYIAQQKERKTHKSTKLHKKIKQVGGNLFELNNYSTSPYVAGLLIILHQLFVGRQFDKKTSHPFVSMKKVITKALHDINKRTGKFGGMRGGGGPIVSPILPEWGYNLDHCI